MPSEDSRDVHLSWMFVEAPQERAKANSVQSTAGAEFQTSSEEGGQVFHTSSEEEKGAVFRTSSEEENGAAAMDTAFQTSSSDNDDFDVKAAASSSAQASAADVASRKRPRRAKYAVQALGKPVCLKAALKILGIGDNRLRRVLRGDVDGRRLPRPRGPANMPLQDDSATTSCLTFLWRAVTLVSINDHMYDL